jgi:NAD(P)-dependent dehydrogenase (short-subunit alcohol dehydrogenase family)
MAHETVVDADVGVDLGVDPGIGDVDEPDVVPAAEHAASASARIGFRQRAGFGNRLPRRWPRILRPGPLGSTLRRPGRVHMDVVRPSKGSLVSDRIVVITGATGKLGPTVASTFAGHGDRLALLARDRAEVEAVAASLPGAPELHIGIAADLATAEGARTAAASVRERLGSPTVLLHLVGGYAGGTPVEEADEALWRDLFELNFWSTFHTLRAFLADIRAATDGRIVTVSTPLAGAPVANIGPYAASKGAVETLTVTIARELAGTSATANVVLVRTIGDEKPTHTRPAEIAAAMAWLASPEAGAVSGQRIPLVGRG